MLTMIVRMCVYFAVCGSRVPEKLLIPPPIPHPAHISVIIHNREATEPIPLDAPLTLQVSMFIYLKVGQVGISIYP